MIINLFSTPIKIIEMTNFQELNKEIENALSLQEGRFKKNFTDNLSEDKANKLQKIFVDEIELYLKELTNKKIEVLLDTSWTTLVPKYGLDTPHHHSTNSVVAVYYLRTFHKCGDLLLHDIRGGHGFLPQYEINTQGDMVSGRSYYRYTPRVGNLIIFPAYVIHSVEPNMSDETRISLAMNFRYKNFNQFNPD